MPNMPTVAEARQAMEVLRRFLDGLNEVFAAPSGPLAGPRSRSGLGAVINRRNVPKTWKDRVLAIMESMGQPVRPRDLTSEYERLGWPRPAGTNVSNLIRSTLVHLKKAGQISVSNGHYTANQQRGG